MKANQLRKEIPFVLIFLIPWIVYFLLKAQLPVMVATHYTVEDGKWIANGYSSPLGLVTGLSFAALVVYFSMSLPSLIKMQQIQLNPAVGQWLYYFKLVIISFVLLMPVYSLLSASYSIRDFSDATIANATMILLLLILNAFIYMLFSQVNKHTPKPVSDKHHNIIWIGTHIVTSLAPLVVILASQGIRAERLIPEVALLFLAVCGNLLYNARPNLYLGIRTPWTLRNTEVWKRTHRVGGVWSFVAGITGFIICVFAPQTWLPFILSSVLILTGAVCIGYSYWIYRKVVPH